MITMIIVIIYYINEIFHYLLKLKGSLKIKLYLGNFNFK